jgi:DNA invertase Pin-like site-specific DNA recombinase
VRGGKPAGLLVAKMDRLSRSVVDGAGPMERAGREGWALHFADLDIDTSTPAGEKWRPTSSFRDRSTNGG